MVSSGNLERVIIPRIALGTFRSTGDEAAAAVRCALRQGNLRAFDTASIYRNEVELGREIREAIRDGIVSRSDLFITSKVSPYEMGAGKAPAAVEGILRRLDLEYLDLLLIHWPGAAKLPLSSEKHALMRRETWRVLEDSVRSGQVRSIGVSNYGIRHLEELLALPCEILPVCNQVECHPLYQQEELRSWCAARGIQVVAYASFGSGNLFGSPAVAQVAREAGDTQARVLLRWALQKNLCVLPKSIMPERIVEYDPAGLEPLPGFPGRYLREAHEQLLDDMVSTEGLTKYCWDSRDVL